jgi:GT2 family glycosyltransferase
MSSRVLVVISYYRCEKWLHACLTSMRHQTRPPENIVVIDDCSPELPVDLLEPFPDVTLLSTTRRVGPEKILDGIVKATSYDAYMIQDADDWSSHDRLDLSLREAERSGADMVGTHEFRINHASRALELAIYPPDINAAMRRVVAHYLLHCTSLMSRALIMRVGGFDQNLKLIADTDFLMRAWHAGQIINLPAFCLFHRIRAHSITTHANTGWQAPVRLVEDRFMKIRGLRNLQSARAGLSPDVFAKQIEEPVGFIHHRGPELQWNHRLSRGTEPR